MDKINYKQFIFKLNKETKEDKIVWRINTFAKPALLDSERVLDAIYSTNVLERKIRLFRLKVKHYFEEDYLEWIETFRLEVVDDEGNSLYTFPDDTAIPDLYDTVKFKTSKVSDLFNEFLTDEN